jgi:hypothetical protein
MEDSDVLLFIPFALFPYSGARTQTDGVLRFNLGGNILIFSSHAIDTLVLGVWGVEVGNFINFFLGSLFSRAITYLINWSAFTQCIFVCTQTRGTGTNGMGVLSASGVDICSFWFWHPTPLFVWHS